MVMPTSQASSSFFTFLPDNLIMELGSDAAIFVARFAIWVRNKLTMGEVDEHGRAWVYNTHDDWVEKTFKFWTARQVRWVVDKLREMGVIQVRDEFDPRGVRVRYYAFTDQNEWLAKTGAGAGFSKDESKKTSKDAKRQKCHEPLTKVSAPTINQNIQIQNKKEDPASEQSSLPGPTESVALVCDFEIKALADEWLEHSKTKRRELDKSWTAESYSKAIDKACRYMGWKTKTLTFCFRLKKDDPEFWGSMLVTPITLLNKWKLGRKIELLEEQCKGDKRFEHARGVQKTNSGLEKWNNMLAAEI